MWCDLWTCLTYARKKKVRKFNFVIATLAILIMGVSTELWCLRIGCFIMHKKCKIQQWTLVLFYLLVAEGIKSNHWPQTESTRGNSSPRRPERSWLWLQWPWKWSWISTRSYRWYFCGYICTRFSWSDQTNRTALFLTLSIQITKSTIG